MTRPPLGVVYARGQPPSTVAAEGAWAGAALPGGGAVAGGAVAGAALAGGAWAGAAWAGAATGVRAMASEVTTATDARTVETRVLVIDFPSRSSFPAYFTL
jgi:hypothetical protein